MSSILSKDVLLKIWDNTAGEYKTIARGTGYSIEINKETIDITSFDVAGWKEFLVDLKEWNASADGIVIRTAETGKKTYEEILASLVDTDTTVVLQLVNPAMYTDSTDGTLYAHEVGAVFLTGMTLTGSLGEKQTYALSMQGSGKLILVQAKYDTEAEAYAARASYSENDVVFVEDNAATGVSGYYERTAAAGTNFGDTWTAVVI